MSTVPSRSAFLTPRSEPAATWVTGIGAVVIVVLFGLLAARNTAFSSAETQLSAAFNAAHVGALGSVTSAIYAIFSPVPAIVITLVIAAAVWLRSRDLRLAITFGVVIAVTWIPSAVVKALVHRPRPDAALLPHPFAVQPTDASYPSGHMVFITALVVTLILLTRGHRLRPLVVALGIVLALVVAFALVIDGVHFTTDVLASAVWSLGLAPLVLEVWNRVVVPRSYPRSGSSRH